MICLFLSQYIRKHLSHNMERRAHIVNSLPKIEVFGPLLRRDHLWFVSGKRPLNLCILDGPLREVRLFSIERCWKDAHLSIHTSFSLLKKLTCRCCFCVCGVRCPCWEKPNVSVFKRTLNWSRIKNLPLFYFNLHGILTCRWYFCGGSVW